MTVHSYKTWGADGIDQKSKDQLTAACDLPVARAAALMADAHLGYGLPIGGVLACDNAVLPYGVGVDIACRMRLTIVDNPRNVVRIGVGSTSTELAKALREGTKFGVGKEFEDPYDHPVMDSERWEATEHLAGLKDKAWKQLGTSGSGNHFVEWGTVYVTRELAAVLDIEIGDYIALLSHSGSRGVGAKTCHKYTKLAKAQNPAGDLSWLDLDTEAGQEYWLSMNLMGDYAAANHECIHDSVMKLAGFEPVAVIENHHNFAWLEDGLIVHRKGATPAAKGELGIVPGSMASPAYIVAGRGHPDSLNSASHGAGRLMSRKEAKRTLLWKTAKADLEAKGIWLLGAGLDEVMGAYKDIHTVMKAQQDLVAPLGQFFPKIVLMDGVGNTPANKPVKVTA